MNQTIASHLTAMAALLVATAACGATVDLAPDGSLDAVRLAVERIRADRKSGKIAAGEVATLRLAAGTYRQTKAIELTADDSHLRITGAGMDATVLSGGMELPRFTAGKGGVWTTRVTPGTRFDQLWVNGRFATRARSPNNGYFYMEQPHEDGRQAFYANRTDIGPIAALAQGELTNVVMHLYMAWQSGYGNLISADGLTGLVRTHPATGWYDYFKWNRYCPRYRLENYRAALDSAGEWFLDREKGIVSYIPRKGETIGSTIAVAPVVTRLLVASNACDVAFSSLGFEHQGFQLPVSCAPEQAACRGVGAALTVSNATKFRFADVALRHLSEYALWLRESTADCDVRRCLVEDVGAGGVRIGEIGNVDFTKVPKRIVVADSIIRRGGRVFPGGIGIFLSHARDCSLEHNEIADFFYTGISVGWTWGYAKTANRNNKVFYNHIHHIGQGVLSDMAGIYTLGRADGTEIVGNVIHDVDSYDYTGFGSSGLYTDEGSGNEVFASNLVYRSKTYAMHQHYGTNNVFRNNILVMNGGTENVPPGSAISVVRRSREEKHRTVSFFGNILYSMNAEPLVAGTFKTPSSGDDMVWKSNLFHCTSEIPTNGFARSSWDAWRKGGQDDGSIIADPLFVDAVHDDYRLRDDSPAKRVGFVPWDFSLAGVRGSAEWKRLANDATMPKVVYAATPPKFRDQTRFESSFENDKPGFFPARMILNRDKKTNESYVRVIRGKGRTGKQCLEVKDSPKCSASYYPFFEVKVSANAKVPSRVAYSIMGDDKTEVFFELRDVDTLKNGRFYAAFAHVGVKNGRFYANGRTNGRFVRRDLMPFTPGMWHDVSIVFDPVAGTWTVQIASEKGAAASATFEPTEPTAVLPSIALFSSNGKTDSTVWYDDISFDVADRTTVSLGYGNVLSLEDLDITMTPEAPLPNWIGSANPKTDVHVTPLDDGSIAVNWKCVPEKDQDVEGFFVGCSLPISTFGGGTVVVDGKSRVQMPESFSPNNIFFLHRTVGRSLVLQSPQGDELLRLEFPYATRVEMQDNRRWDGDTYGLRLHFHGLRNRRLVTGEKYRLSCLLKGVKPFAFATANKIRLTPGLDWIAMKPCSGIEEGSALDFSKIRGVDVPAGKHGRVVCRGQNFEFELLPGVPQRFYGVNLCFDANTPDLATARKFARELAKTGYNAIRFHHHESSLVKPDGLTIDEEKMKRFDGLVAACIENGIYMTTDLFVSRSPISYRSVGIDLDGNVQMAEYKDLVQFHDGVQSNFLAWTRSFLNHVNCYTQRRYADEPALAWLSLVNEGNVGNKGMVHLKKHPIVAKRWRDWLAEKKRQQPKLFGDIPEELPNSLNDAGNPHQAAFNFFIADYERAFARKVTAVLRDELKCKALITNMNNWHYTLQNQIPRVEEYDYVDDHFYVDHPQWLGNLWSLPSRCNNANPILGNAMGAQALVARRDLQKPFTITEYNFSGPGRFRGVGGIVCGASAALQNWAGLWRFAWTHGVQGLQAPETKMMGYFDMAGDPLSLAAERASICLFLRRDLPELRDTCAIVQPPSEISAFNRVFDKNTLGWTWASWYAKLGGCVAEKAPSNATWQFRWPEAYRLTREQIGKTIFKNGVAPVAGDGRVAIDQKSGSFFVRTDCTSGGFAEKGIVDGGALVAKLSRSPATVWASTLDGKPFGETKRVLVTHLTDVQNSGITYGDVKRQILLRWGSLPHIMRNGRADVSLGLGKGEWQVWRLASNGHRLAQVPCEWKNGRLCFVAAVDATPGDASYLYEALQTQTKSDKLPNNQN